MTDKELQQLVKYYNTSVVYDQNKSIDSKGAEITFINMGDGNFPNPAGATVIVLGCVVIKPGFGVAFDGKEGELDVTKYSFIFSGAGVRNLLVLQKQYA